jgi:hypothetical protein
VRTKISFGLMLAVAILALIVTVSHPWSRPASHNPEQPAAEGAQVSSEPADIPTEAARPAISAETVRKTTAAQPAQAESPVVTQQPALGTNKLERLNQIRETFVALAAGNATNALRAARQITNETERETALLALVTQWTQGQLGSAKRRAGLISAFGIEAGLGMELTRDPDLAVLWANELTEGDGRALLLEETAAGMLASDPEGALALVGQFPVGEQQKFLDSVFARWGAIDTEAALNRADQMQDPAARDAAIAAIRTMAPVGIGAALGMQDGYAVVNQLFPGTPAELSGQIHPGDRIVALAQGDNAFVDAHGMPLKDIVDMVRGAPNTTLQLQLLAADAGPGTPPRTISILRNQLKFKR